MLHRKEGKGRRFAAMLLAMMLVFSMHIGGVNAKTTDEENKTITVTASDGASAIQDAINLIAQKEDSENWTIVVGAGTYNRFAISEKYDLDGLTIESNDDDEVIISVFDGSDAPTGVDGTQLFNGSNTFDPGGIYVNCEDVTISGLTFWEDEDTTSYTYASFIGTFNNAAGTVAENLTVTNCNFVGTTVSRYGIFVNGKMTTFTVSGCTFSNLKSAIEMMCDNVAVDATDGITVSGNVFTGCNFAMHGYYGNGSVTGGGTITFTNNIVTGTSALRSKVVYQDSGADAIGDVIISNNTFTYAMVGIVNLSDVCSAEEILSNSGNEFGVSSYCVEAIEPGKVTAYSTYYAPEDDEGYWVLTGIDDLEVDWGGNPDGTIEYVQSLITYANENGLHTLTITTLNGTDDEDDLIRTFTWFKDAIYWVSSSDEDSEYTYKYSTPGSEKWILVDGEELSEDSINAGDTVKFELKSNVPETLISADADYLTWTYDEETGEVVCTGSYILTFHDTIDSAFTIDYDTLTVTIDGVELDSSYYTVTTECSDGCTFELSIDLIALYNAGQLTEDQISSAVDVVVTYNATLSDDATAGTYTNKSHVTYEGGTTPDSTVTEYVYGVKVYKYDSSETTTDEDGNTTYTKLIAGAGFTLYRTATTDEDGNVTYSDPVTTTDEDGETVVEVFYTDENGYLCFDGLEAGTYYLKEVEVPDGYVASGAVITITLPEENATDYYVVCEVLNTPIPNTGGVGTTMFLIVGLALIVGAGTAYGVKNRRVKA